MWYNNIKVVSVGHDILNYLDGGIKIMSDNRTELSINTSVIEKMAEIAAKEIEGVAGISKKAIDLKGAVKTKNAFKGVKVENINGAIKITVFITVYQRAHINEIAEQVQVNVKEKIQNMTGSAVTQVDVVISDVKFEESETEAE